MDRWAKIKEFTRKDRRRIENGLYLRTQTID
jgi:hypothetical protein